MEPKENFFASPARQAMHGDARQDGTKRNISVIAGDKAVTILKVFYGYVRDLLP